MSHVTSARENEKLNPIAKTERFPFPEETIRSQRYSVRNPSGQKFSSHFLDMPTYSHVGDFRPLSFGKKKCLNSFSYS